MFVVVQTNEAYANKWAGITFDGYLTAEGVEPSFTFKFRDGTETHEFQVVRTTSDFALNRGTSFEVQGVVGNAPLLHKALDDAYKFNSGTGSGSNLDHPYKYFDIDAEFTREGESRKTFHFNSCSVGNYEIDTLTHSSRGYLETPDGFAIVETIEFVCKGVHSDITSGKYHLSSHLAPYKVNEYPKLDYTYADNIRTFVTFDFLKGHERIEVPIFTMQSGFGKNEDPRFLIEHVPNKYPMLQTAINIARASSSLASTFDFDAKVEFIQDMPLGSKLLREINYEDCQVTNSGVNTRYDHEEPYVLLGGFVVVQTINFECNGLSPVNPRYDAMFGDSEPSTIVNEQLTHNYKTGAAPTKKSVFTFADQSVEIIDFPVFRQYGILSSDAATFELEGILGDFPLLHKQVDAAAKLNEAGGSTRDLELFDVDIIFNEEDEVVRQISYTDCFVSDYIVAHQEGNEEPFWFGIALENNFKFDCMGYHPQNPLYEEVSETPKADTTSSLDLDDVPTWEDFY